MPNFTAGTSFTDGVTNDVTAAKLNALVADAVPTSSLSLNSTTGTIATFNSTTGTIANLSATTSTFLGTITGSTNVVNIGSGQIYKDANGNVGIGTVSPTAQVTISKVVNSATLPSTSANHSISLYPPTTSGYYGGGISWSEGANTAANICAVDDGASGALGLVLSTGNNSAITERLRIDSSGNVGIGTASPSQKLDIQSASASVQIKSTTATNSAILKIENNSTAYIGNESSTINSLFLGTTAYATCLGNTGAYPVQLATNNNVRMTIDSSGNVGIGVTSPADTNNFGRSLDIRGSTGAAAYFRDSNDASKYSVTGFFGADSNAYLGSWGASTGVVLYSSGTERLRIDSSGFLMAGATSQEGAVTFKFNVQNQDLLKIRNTSSSDAFGVSILMDATTANIGSILRCFASTSTQVLNIAGNGNVTNTNNSYGAISDIKLKENIEDATSQWSDIKSLNVRKFSFKNDESHSRFLGLIAQEVEQISPNLVEESQDYEQVDVMGENGETKKENRPTGTTTKSVKYSILYMKAVKALQEAMGRIEQLEAKVTALEAA